MKKFYFIFFAICVIFFALMYYSIWWFVAGLATIMVFAVYRFYFVRLESVQVQNELLEYQVEQLNMQLDHSMSKEMKTSKEIERVKELKQELLSVMSHEIRTPMNGIMGMSLLLKETQLTNEQREYADTICSCGETLLTKVNEILADDVLNLSKINSEEQKLECKDFDLRDSIEEVLQLFAVKAANAGLHLMYDMDEKVPCQVIGDNKRMQQVLINLVDNAVKFTPAGGEICLTVYALIHGVDKPELIFEVKDTGIGISGEQVKQLFKGIPGKESKNENDNRSPGLGLVICKKLVLLMGGYIDVKTELGKGSNFSFNIPLMPSLKAIYNQAGMEYLGILEGKNILLADANASQRKILLKQMQTWKVSPFLADSGKQTLNVLSRETKMDLILIDSNLTDIPGIELAKSIKSKYPATPIILINSMGNENDIQEKDLFSSVLSKPIRHTMLRDRMIEIFSKDNNTGEQPAKRKLSEDFAMQYPLHILVAEDNLVNQKLAMKTLTKLGYQPQLAKDGKEVMEMVGQEHYDIILMDVQMPEMDGLEATRMIRTCLETQPVIMAMTANVMMGDRDECMQAGMDDYISKPLELNELLDKFEKWSVALNNKRKASNS